MRKPGEFEAVSEKGEGADVNEAEKRENQEMLIRRHRRRSTSRSGIPWVRLAAGEDRFISGGTTDL